ncbi:hypothetical protein C2869_08570 [Saccharobesus litoralis]|uniref:Uncharacterized protein n=1 Tax=Saccharobesus litoralis TaxID=2172099 RepID=A0A2S0VQJ3_9ALTE|nr:DUF4097 family beta strand repeat-containing protein [Saccharobesus litoralis]AWB66478.1 hypothetical protein C2869_08570 [Saccharobesus litoralis]
MKAPIIALLASAFVTLSGCVVVIGDKQDWHSKRHHIDIDPKQAQQLLIDADAGNLNITTDANAAEIKLVAKIQSIDKHIDPDQVIRIRRDEGVIYIDSNQRTSFDYSWRNPQKIDLTLTLPENMLLSVKQGSGDMAIKGNYQALNITDGSGNLFLNDINGPVDVHDGSGNIKITSVSGKVNIEDGSGQIDASHITGDTQIKDGSGDLTLKNITGQLYIDDGSGDINASHIQGSVSVEDGAGDIRIKQANSFTLIQDGSGEVSLSNVNVSGEQNG